MTWSMSSDYCTWEGVTCDNKTGNVIGLDLSCSQLEGAIFPKSTLFQFSHLQFLDLTWNAFSLSNQFPQEFGFFAKDLTHLNLSNTGFSGRVPQNLTQLRVLNLEAVDISSVLPTNLSTSLRVLDLAVVAVPGVLPQEVFHHPNLEVLDLYFNSIAFSDIVPEVKWGRNESLFNLSTSLRYLILGGRISGVLPQEVFHLPNLEVLEIWAWELSNNLTAALPKDLGSNSLTGPLPSWLFANPLLQVLDLSYNRFTDLLHEFDSSNSQLQVFSCGHNLLYGPIPQSFFQLVNLTQLVFSSNNFSGVLDSEMFSHLKNLYTLDFSHNSLSVRNTSMVTLPPKLHHLGLASCNMKEFPRFSADAKFIEHIDLSKNELHGEIPHGIGSMSWDLYSYLNLSRNRLTGGLEHINWNDIWYLDIQSNLLNGSLPNLFCNSSSLKILNLSYNNLSGVLPICQTNLTRLLVFDLRMNNIQGNIPPTFSNFRNLKSINLYGNKLEGRVPTSFSELEQLETLDLGSNQLHDTFPQCLESLPNIRVLVLKSNNFHGLINQSSKIEHPFPNLRKYLGIIFSTLIFNPISLVDHYPPRSVIRALFSSLICLITL
ncbi:receptor-like protein 40 [Apium graveolens]|uniref:receptor-like protein 40 n=1 Tax=Apium graveolens TaxID=4045 RepID=UPI003D7BD03F